MEDRDKIRSLQEELYSRKSSKDSYVNEHKLRRNDQNIEVKDSFGNLDYKKPFKDDYYTFEEDEKERMKASLTTLSLVGSVIFFIGALAYTFYSFTHDSNVVTSNNIDIGISGPVSSPGGEKLSLSVSITNRNKTPLVATDLIVQYPSGTRRADDPSKEINTERIDIGDIKSGSSVSKTINVILYGEEKSVADIKFDFEYRIQNSNAIFSKDVPYDIVISSNPISLTVDAPKESISGQDLPITVHLHSNANEILKNVLLTAQYPSGFAFSNSDPNPNSDKQSWSVGDMAPGDDRTITIHGKLNGEDQESRVFRFNSGLADTKNPNQISTSFSGFKQEVAIKKPFIGLSMSINGDNSGDVVAPPNSPIKVEVFYSNNLPVAVNDVSVSLNLSGLGLDKSGVVVDQGYYQSVNDTVLWDKTSVPAFSSLSPGDSGKLTLTLTPKSSNVSNPQIILTGSVNGRRVEEGNVPQQVVGSLSRTIKIKSATSFSSKLEYRSGPLSNMGPLPPKSDKETTYTVTWSIVNGSNDLTDVVVSAPTFPYVRFIGEATPSSENISYDAVSKKIVWNAGVVRAGTGVLRGSKQVSFKIGFTPSVSQVGNQPALIGAGSLVGNDRFTNTDVNVETGVMNTTISDSSSRNEDGTVVK